MSFSILVSAGYMPGSGIIGSYGSFILVFKGISILFSIVAVSLQPKNLINKCKNIRGAGDPSCV